MLISSSSSPALPAFLQHPQASIADSNPLQTGANTPEASTPDNSNPANDTVELSSQPSTTFDDRAGVYAEIWKDGRKIAEVDVRGSVTPLNGFIAPVFGGTGGGPELAARRASQIAVTVGGEIRSNGETIDSQTLKMRARLNTYYGV